MIRTGIIAAILGALAIGCGEPRNAIEQEPPANALLPAKAREILTKASEISLVSLQPLADERKSKDKEAGGASDGWRVLGSTIVKSPETRAKLLSTLEKNLSKSRNGAKCFHPRHAIEAKHDGKTVELLICFECGWLHVSVNGFLTDRIEMDSKGQEIFDDVLRRANVPLSKQGIR